MKRTRTILALALGLTALGVGAAGAQSAFANLFGQKDKASAQDQAHNAALAKAAWQTVASHKAEMLGASPPLNLPAYAPIYPDGLILLAAMDPDKPRSGSAQYDAAAPVGAVLEFYKTAAAANRLPVKDATVTSTGDATFAAGDGRRAVTIKLTKQFANSTVVDIRYD